MGHLPPLAAGYSTRQGKNATSVNGKDSKHENPLLKLLKRRQGMRIVVFGTKGNFMSITFGQAAALLCVATTVGVILYEPIIKPVREAIKEFNQNRRSKIKPAEPNPATNPPPKKTLLRLVK